MLKCSKTFQPEVNIVYKIVARTDWEAARRAGSYLGSADDLRDGFIHLSTREQLEGTLARHFTGQTDLVLVALDIGDLAADLRWEAASSGRIYPHLYRPLAFDAVLSETALTLGSTGQHALPEELDRC